jgi:CcmD family protein
MDALSWLMWANITVWIGLGAYAAFLARNQKRLRDRFLQREDTHV